jgi:hypothetical protein
LAEKLELEYVELDAILLGSGGIEPSMDDFLMRFSLGREKDDPASLPIRTQPLSHPRAHCTLNRQEFIVATAFGQLTPSLQRRAQHSTRR